MDVHPISGYGLYSASKGYINSFSSALAAELKYDKTLDSPIDCCVYCPGAVSTKLNGLSVICCLIPDPLAAARTSLHDLGRF
jgi:short-subunit dehydrogenase